MKRRAEMKEAAAGRKAAGLQRCVSTGRLPETDVAARLAEIPPDDRDFTGRMFGDPLPARSALKWQNPYGEAYPATWWQRR